MKARICDMPKGTIFNCDSFMIMKLECGECIDLEHLCLTNPVDKEYTIVGAIRGLKLCNVLTRAVRDID